MTLENNYSEYESEGLPQVDNSEALAAIQKSLEQIETLKEKGSQVIEEDIETEATEASVPEEGEIQDDTEEVQESELDEEKVEKKKASDDTKVKDKKSDKYRKLQNDKYRALAEKAAAEERIKELEQMLNDSVSSSTYHYGKNVFTELNQAKENKKKAIENGDVEGLIEADIALTKAINSVNELEKWAEQDAKNAAAHSLPNVEHNINTKVKEEMAYDWLESHPYLQPTSRNYNAELATNVAEFVNYLDDNLRRKNQMDIYYSPEYFNAIDEYIESLDNRPQPKRTTGNISSLPPVGGVRNHYAGTRTSSASNPKIQLTADEKRMCANMGMPENEWIKYKLEEQNNRRKA